MNEESIGSHPEKVGTDEIINGIFLLVKKGWVRRFFKPIKNRSLES